MTNKLPIIGKKYKLKDNDKIITVSRIENGYTYIKEIKDTEYATFNPQYFLNYYEELSETEESIWKPVSEMPKNYSNLFVQLKDGNIVTSFSGNCLEDIDKWCYLSDFINDQENLKQKVKELEKQIKNIN